MAIAPHREENFPGQHLVVLPQSVRSQMQRHPLLSGLFPTAAGYFPEAPGHLVRRGKGLADTILIVCLSGSGWVSLHNAPPLSIHANEAVFIPAHVPHTYGAESENPWSIMWAHCRGSDLPAFLDLLHAGPSPVIPLPVGAFERMQFRAIYEHLENGYSLANLLASATHLRFVFSEIHRLRLATRTGTRSAEHSLEQSIAWMRRHLHRRIRLADLAHEAGLSVPHYSALFKRQTGFAPIDYLLGLKIQRACQLLDTTTLRIEEIAASIGCDDAFYFSRLFKKAMGCSPRSYRQIQKG